MTLDLMTTTLAPRQRASLVCLLALVVSYSISGSGNAAAQTATPAAGAQSAEAPSPAAGPALSSTASQSMLYPGDDFHLAPGDLIVVRVFLQSDYQATVRVDQDGNVKLPYIGSVNVKDLTVRAAQTLVADRLRAGEFFKQPEVTIQVLDTVNGSVIITGEVRQIVPVSTQRSLKEVLLIAGGLPALASHTVKIVRKKSDGMDQVIVVDLGTDLASSTTANVPVYPHDIIQITRASVVYVLGAFSRQNSVPLDQASPLTLLQVVALSGGVGFEGKYDDLRIIRTVGTERKVVEVDVRKVRDGKAPDPVLQANDIVFLPTNPMKAILKGLGVGGVLGLVSLVYSLKNY